MYKFKRDFWGFKAGDIVPDGIAKILEVEQPEVMEKIETEEKMIESPKDKMIGKSPKDK